MRRLLLLLPLLTLFAACEEPPATADTKEAAATSKITEQAVQQTGMPGVTNFTEKKIVRELYELRDQNVSTYSYVPDMQGRLWHLCDSIGYGLPYGVQFSNPEKVINDGIGYDHYYHGTLPQAEPNGLFMPPSAEGTWIICGNENGKIKPVYVEPRVIVSPFKLNTAGEYLVKQ